MAGKMSGIGLASTAGGILFIYGGVKGYSPLKAVQNIILGKSGSLGQKSNLLTGTGGTNSPGTAPTGPVGSPSQVWIQEGGNPAKVSIAACIVSHESGGRADATSANPDGGTNVGWYQLDTPGGKGAGYTIEQLKDPRLNTRVAIKASNNGQDWSAWSTAPMCGV